MVLHMSASIDVDQICGNVEGWKGVLKYRCMLAEDVPILLAYAVSSFVSSDGSKFKGTVDERIEVCYIQPLPKREEIMPLGIIIRCVRWADEVRVGV